MHCFSTRNKQKVRLEIFSAGAGVRPELPSLGGAPGRTRGGQLGAYRRAATRTLTVRTAPSRRRPLLARTARSAMSWKQRRGR